MGVVLCECTKGVHMSSCLRVLEEGSVVNDALNLIRFVHKPLLQVGLVQVHDVLLAFGSRAFRCSLFYHCLNQSLEIVSYEATAPGNE